jgi:hypothetical protein
VSTTSPEAIESRSPPTKMWVPNSTSSNNLKANWRMPVSVVTNGGTKTRAINNPPSVPAVWVQLSITMAPPESANRDGHKHLVAVMLSAASQPVIDNDDCWTPGEL